MMHKLGLKLGLGVLLVFLTVGCASQTIKGDELYGDVDGFRIGQEADIPDETEYREALDVLVQYRKALVQKDVGALKRLISKDYYDNAGSTDTTDDDYGHEKLPDIFEMLANYADEIKYNVTVKRVQFKHKRAMIDYEYEYAYKYDVGEKATWDAGVEVNRLELVTEDGRWKIASGL